jgi:hypothetical protein
LSSFVTINFFFVVEALVDLMLLSSSSKIALN